MQARPLLLVVLAAGIAGIGISIYLTVVHFTTSVALVCETGGVVNCERVISSPYGTIAGTGIPTSAAGIVWFAVSAGLAALRLRQEGAGLARAHLLWGAAGLLTVLYLVFVEIDRIGAICAWCTGAHLLVLLTFMSVLALSSGAGGPVPARR